MFTTMASDKVQSTAYRASKVVPERAAWITFVITGSISADDALPWYGFRPDDSPDFLPFPTQR